MSIDARRRLCGQRGVTLLELIAAMIVIGVALAAVLSVYVVVIRGSVDPMERQQAQFIAEAYLEEILLRRFFDPEDDVVCQAVAEPRRDLYDNVCDYNGLNEAPRDQFGSLIPGVGAYNVQVAVLRGAPPDPAAPQLNGLDNAGVNRVLRVDVTVSGPNGAAITLTGYRTNYTCNAAGNPGCVP